MDLPLPVNEATDRIQLFEQEAMPHLPSLLSTALRSTRNRAAAEDAVQETMLRAWRAFDKFQPGTNCKAWLFRILFNLLTKQYHQARLRPETVPLDNAEHATDLLCARPADRPSQQEILSAIDALPADQRSVLVLSLVEGFKCREIADILSLPIGTVMSRLSRARTVLRENLSPTGAAGSITS